MRSSFNPLISGADRATLDEVTGVTITKVLGVTHDQLPPCFNPLISGADRATEQKRAATLAECDVSIPSLAGQTARPVLCERLKKMIGDCFNPLISGADRAT